MCPTQPWRRRPAQPPGPKPYCPGARGPPKPCSPPPLQDLLVQRYISNPLLLGGFKFDMRVYAAATCLDPLRLYVFEDGLARLATEQYSADKADLKWVALGGNGDGGGDE